LASVAMECPAMNSPLAAGDQVLAIGGKKDGPRKADWQAGEFLPGSQIPEPDAVRPRRGQKSPVVADDHVASKAAVAGQASAFPGRGNLPNPYLRGIGEGQTRIILAELQIAAWGT